MPFAFCLFAYLPVIAGLVPFALPHFILLLFLSLLRVHD
jgi:hypothetical protein